MKPKAKATGQGQWVGLIDEAEILILRRPLGVKTN